MSQCQCVHTPLDPSPFDAGVRCPNEAVGKVESGAHSWEMCGPCIKDLAGELPPLSVPPEPLPSGFPIDIREPHIR